MTICTPDRIFGAVTEMIFVLASEVTAVSGHPRLLQELVQVGDVRSVGFVVGGIELDDGPGLIRLRTESHAGILRQNRVTADEPWLVIVGEPVQEDGEQSWQTNSRSISFLVIINSN